MDRRTPVGRRSPVDRRTLLERSGVALATVVGLGGCLARDGEPAAGTGTGAGDGRADSPTDDGQTDDPTFFADHAATDAVDAQPYFGPEPGAATGTIVAFEDPSCLRCAAFERETVPKIRSELVEPGDATFVFRGYPVVYPWGEPATKALEATVARDEAAHWSLLEHYFAEQGSFSEDDVLRRTRAYLDDETALDGAAIVADVREGAFDDEVRTDLDAGETAGAGNVTPTVFLFRDGEYRTTARGSVSFSVVRNALGL